MWTSRTRAKYARTDLAYASSLRIEEWRLIEPLVPPPAVTGRPRLWPVKLVFDAIFYIMRSGCQWRLLPSDFPPWQTVYGWFVRLRESGIWERMNHAPVMTARERCGREASPTAGVIDSQSVKATEATGPRGYDADKKIKGSKRHILTDTEGHLLSVVVHPCVDAMLNGFLDGPLDDKRDVFGIKDQPFLYYGS